MSSRRVAAVDVFPVGIPLTRTFTFSSGSTGAAGDVAPHVFVRVTDSEGEVGWGEGRPIPSWGYETGATVATTLRDHLAPAVIGMPIGDRWGMHDRMRRAIGLGPSTGAPVAKAALDVALHDLCARAAGMTLRSYLGGSDERREIPLSWTVIEHDAAAAHATVTEARAAGFRHFNFKVAVTRATDVAVAAAIRHAAGPEAFVWADANQGLALHEARRLAHELHEAGVDLLEQPFRADAPHLMRELRRNCPIALAADESSVSPADFFRLAAEGVVDYLVVKVTRSGGLWPTLQQIAVAEAAGLELIVSGLTDSLVTKLAACQAAVAFGCTAPAGLNGSQFLDDSALFPGKAELEAGGTVRLPDVPGVGAAPDEAALVAARLDL